MEPKFQTSFIPKNPGLGGQSATMPYVRERNIFSTASTVLFVLMLLVSGGLFGYKIILTNKKETASNSLVAARTTLEPQKIQTLIDANSRIVSTKNLLDKHVVLSELLVLLQQITLQKVSFSSLAYKNMDNKPTISLTAEALGYNAIAAQEDVFAKNDFIKNPIFSDFSLDTNGGVKLTIFAELVPKLISYKDILQSVSSATSTRTENMSIEP